MYTKFSSYMTLNNIAMAKVFIFFLLTLVVVDIIEVSFDHVTFVALIYPINIKDDWTKNRLLVCYPLSTLIMYALLDTHQYGKQC